MKCWHARRQMAALLDAALEPAAAEALRAHIEACDQCRTLFGAMQAADQEAHEALCAAAKRAELSGQFTARVLTEITRREGRRIPFMHRPEVRRLVFVAASALVVAIGVWVAAHILVPRSGPEIVKHTPDKGGPEPARRAGFVLTTLDLPSVHDLARELLPEESSDTEPEGQPVAPESDEPERPN